MIIEKERINNLPNYIDFCHEGHKKLSISFLEKIANEIDFRLKILKASIQLIKSQSFAVIGLRRSQEHIFIEFYSEALMDNTKIIKTIKGRNGFIINQVNISNDGDIDSELIRFIIHSCELLNKGGDKNVI